VTGSVVVRIAAGQERPGRLGQADGVASKKNLPGTVTTSMLDKGTFRGVGVASHCLIVHLFDLSICQLIQCKKRKPNPFVINRLRNKRMPKIHLFDGTEISMVASLRSISSDAGAGKCYSEFAKSAFP